MPRTRRPDLAGVVVHLLNRSVRRETLFSTDADYAAFEDVLAEALAACPIRILAFCVLPNHWHFVVWPESTRQLARFVARLTQMHAMRWHRARGTVGTGAVYGGRYKAFVVESDEAVYRVTRYVERNALRAGLVERAEDWPWGSPWHRSHGDPRRLLAAGPLPLPPDWAAIVNRAQSMAELEALRRSADRGTPYGSPGWVERMARDFGLLSSVRPRGRPRKGV